MACTRETRCCPPGWVAEMTRASRVNAETGMQVTRLIVEGDARHEALRVTDDNGSAFWVIPQLQLAILNIAGPGGGSLPELPALLLKGLGVPSRGSMTERKYRVARRTPARAKWLPWI